MEKSKWIWMPHSGHLIIGDKCQFHLNTYVGKYLVSTVGEWWPERISREIHAEIYDKEWLIKNRSLIGDEFDFEYRKRFGFEEIGAGRKYETMVFNAEKSNNLCCPYKASDWISIDCDGYNTAGEAYHGHSKLCLKWSKK